MPKASILVANGHMWLLVTLPTTQSKIAQPAECSSGSGPRWWDALVPGGSLPGRSPPWGGD